jgi:PIN domain nuclease of toxin-antitoxin system
MSALVADTHSIIWYVQGNPKLSTRAHAAMDGAMKSGDSICISAISLVEMTYLVERRRIPTEIAEQIWDLSVNAKPLITLVPVDAAVARALVGVRRQAIPEMPDRIIAATARHLRLPLVSADEAIRASGMEVIW